MVQQILLNSGKDETPLCIHQYSKSFIHPSYISSTPRRSFRLLMTVGRKGVLELHSSNIPRFHIYFIRRRSWASTLEFILRCPAFSRLVSTCRMIHSSSSTNYSSISYTLFAQINIFREVFIHKSSCIRSLHRLLLPAFVTVAPLPSSPPLWSEGNAPVLLLGVDQKCTCDFDSVEILNDVPEP